jgi:CarD family transcriptional regulator
MTKPISKAAPQKAASNKSTESPAASKTPAKPMQAAPLQAAPLQTKAPAAAPQKPEPKTVEKLTTAPKPKAEAKPEVTAPKAKPAAKAEAPKVAKSAAAPALAPKAAAVAKAPAPPPAPSVAEPHEPAPAAAPAAIMHAGVAAGPMRPMAPPRAMAKAEIFVDGDFVVYPTHGVGKVERIATEEIAGHTLELIHITFDENRMTLRVPTNKARTAGLRKLASKKQFDEVLATLKGRARIKRTMWSRRAQEYEAKINSGDPQAIAEVVRDLHRNAGQPDQSFSERQIYESALDRLAAEFAALERVDKPTAIERLISHLKSE